MMIFIGFAVIAVSVGIYFAVKGGVFSNEEEAVPISNPKEIEELKNAFLPPEEKRGVAAAPQDAVKKPSLVSKAKRFLPQSSKQAEIDQLTEENRRLRQDAAGQEEKYQQLEQNLEALKKEYHEVKQGESQETENLKSKVAKIQIEKERLLTNHDLIKELKEKGESLERKYQQYHKQQEELSGVIKQLESENAELLKAKDQCVDRNEFDSLNSRLESSIRTIEQLKGENKGLQMNYEDLKVNFKNTEALNNQLLEKEKLVQYELTKNRAQNLGLEKMCKDFKIQIEKMSAGSSDKPYTT